MASTAAVLNILVAANTAPASAQLVALDTQLKKTAATANTTSGAVGGGMAKSGKLGAVGMAALAVGAAGAAKFLSNTIRVTADFEQKMSSLKATTSASTKEMARLEQQAMRMGKATVFSATEAAAAQIELAKGGLSVAQILSGGLDSALALAAAGELNLASAAETTVNAMRLFDIEGRKSMQVADMLATAANKTTADVADFAMALSQGGAVAKQAGLSLNQTVTVLEALAESGVKGSDAGTSMKAALVQLINPTTKQTELARKLGIEFLNQNGEMKSASQLSKELRGATEGFTKAERTKTFAVLAGTDGFRALSALYDAGPDKLNRLTKANREYGTAIDTASTKTDNLRGDLEEMGGAVEDLQIKLGKSGNPVFRAAIQGLTKLIEGLGEAFLDTSLGNTRFFQQLRSIPKTVQSIFLRIRELTASTGAAITKLFSRAWNGAKNATVGKAKEIAGSMSGLLGSTKRVFSQIRGAIVGAFQGAMNRAKAILEGGKKAIVSIVNAILNVIDLIPTIDPPRIGDGSGKSGPIGPQKPRGYQRGGVLSGGRPTGDSIPAMLERGEYVLNRKAVKKIGVKRLNAINFKTAPRFQKGGAIGLQRGGYLDTLAELPGKFVKPIADAGTAALNLLMNGPGQFLKMLPKPNIPEPFTGVGPYLLSKATEFIKKNATSPLKDNAWVDSNTMAVARFLASKFGASISSGYRSPSQNAAVGGVPNSSHTRGTPSNPGAIDFVPPSSAMQSFAGSNIAGIVENMIHDVGSGLHNHIAFFQRGGLAGRAMRGANRGGWFKTGYTVFDDSMGYRGPIRGKAYAELGAPNGGVGYISRLLGINKELPLDYPLDVKVNGKIARLYKRDIGTGQGTSDYSIDIWKSMWSYFGLNQFSKGPAWIRAANKGGGKGGGKTEAEKEAERREDARRKKVVSKIGAAGFKYTQKKALATNAALINRQNELIGVSEALAGAGFGPGGQESTESEIAEQIALYRKLFEFQQARVKLLLLAIQEIEARIANFRKKAKGAGWKREGFEKGAGNAKKTVNELKGGLRTLVGITGVNNAKAGKFGQIFSGELGQTNITLKELGVSSAAGSADSELASLLREQLTVSQRNLAIAQAQAPIFQQFMPKFHQGGIVQGPMGAERPIMAQAGEGVFTRDQMRAMGAGNITVVIEDGAIDSNRIRVEVDGVLQDKISTVRRTTPNRRYATR